MLGSNPCWLHARQMSSGSIASHICIHILVFILVSRICLGIFWGGSLLSGSLQKSRMWDVLLAIQSMVSLISLNILYISSITSLLYSWILVTSSELPSLYIKHVGWGFAFFPLWLLQCVGIFVCCGMTHWLEEMHSHSLKHSCLALLRVYWPMCENWSSESQRSHTITLSLPFLSVFSFWLLFPLHYRSLFILYITICLSLFLFDVPIDLNCWIYLKLQYHSYVFLNIIHFDLQIHIDLPYVHNIRKRFEFIYLHAMASFLTLFVESTFLGPLYAFWLFIEDKHSFMRIYI